MTSMSSESPGSGQGQLVWRGLIPLRVALSLLTLALVLWSDRGRTLATDLRVLIGLIAGVNVLISLPWRRVDGRMGDYSRIVFDSVLSLCVIFLSSSVTSSLVWVALLIPVIEAAAIAPVAAVAIWFAVSLLYTSLRVVMPGSTDTSFVSGMQQLLSVGIVGIPLARWSHRTSTSLRMAAVEKRSAGRYAFSLRQVGEYVSRLTQVRSMEEVDAIVLSARRALNADRSELMVRDGDDRWRLARAEGTALQQATPVLLDHALASIRPVVARELDAIAEVEMAGFRAAVAVDLGEKRSAVWRLWFGARQLNRHDSEALDLLTSAIRQAYRTVAEIERLKSWSEELERRANIDQLTGVLNRRGLELAVEELNADQGGDIAALYLDLNRFKPINDQYGHESGDRVLQIVARRFEACLPVGAVLARVGGDEFAIVVEIGARPADLEALRLRLEQSLHEPIMHNQQPLRVSVSVGVGRAVPGTELDELLRRADVEMYERKRAQAQSPPDPVVS